jgi:hypothetical protein
MRQKTGENERVAALLSGQRITTVRYFLLSFDDGQPEEWDFGVWHQPTMGVELVTENGDTFSAIWNQYEEWGFGVDLFAEPVATHMVEGAADSWVVVSGHALWSRMTGFPVEVGFVWNDFGTGRPPCPEAVKIAAGGAVAWIIAAGWERQESRFEIHLGLDDLMVVGNERFVEVLGLFDAVRGRPSRPSKIR